MIMFDASNADNLSNQLESQSYEGGGWKSSL